MQGQPGIHRLEHDRPAKIDPVLQLHSVAIDGVQTNVYPALNRPQLPEVGLPRRLGDADALALPFKVNPSQRVAGQCVGTAGGGADEDGAPVTGGWPQQPRRHVLLLVLQNNRVCQVPDFTSSLHEVDQLVL